MMILDKHVDDEIARRKIEGTWARPTDGWREFAELSQVPARTMEEWCDASALELLDGPAVISFADQADGGSEEDWS